MLGPRNTRARSAVAMAGAFLVAACPVGHTDHFGSYFVPIPDGSIGVMVGLSSDPVGPWPGPFGAKDFSVWRR